MLANKIPLSLLQQYMYYYICPSKCISKKLTLYKRWLDDKDTKYNIMVS